MFFLPKNCSKSKIVQNFFILKVFFFNFARVLKCSSSIGFLSKKKSKNLKNPSKSNFLTIILRSTRSKFVNFQPKVVFLINLFLKKGFIYIFLCNFAYFLL